MIKTKTYKKQIVNYKNRIIDLDPVEVQYKKLVVNGKEYKEYSVSNFGEIYSHFVKEQDNLGRWTAQYVPNSFTKLSGSLRKDYFYIKICIDGIKKNLDIHKLIMNAFGPIDLNPPHPITMEDWSKTPESSRQVIRGSILINHIDHCKTNNFIGNLEYATHQENANACVKRYGGDCRNKSKFNKQKFAVVLHNNELFFGEGVTKFTEEHNIHQSCFSKLLKGERKSCKGIQRYHAVYANNVYQECLADKIINYRPPLVKLCV